MTSDKKTRPSPTVQRRPLDPEERFQRRVTLAFIALTVAIVAVVVIGVGYDYWNQHLRSVASVNGTGISRDQWTDRARLEAFRLEREDRRVTAALAAGELTATQGAARREAIAAAKGDVGSSSIESLIDLTFKGQLAAQQGVTVTDAAVDAAVAADASLPETRTIGLIQIEPDAVAETAAAGRQAAFTAANEAAAALAAGTPFEDVAKQYSTAAGADQGGDYGSIRADDETLDPALVGAIFAAAEGEVTPLLAGADGSFSIARVNSVTPATPDPGYEQDLREEMSWDAYRGNVRMETTGDALEAATIATATIGDKPQLHLAEIWLEGDPEATEDDSGLVRASHILYSPEDDPTGPDGERSRSELPLTDPTWTVAQAEAGLALQQLNGITDPVARQAAFTALARTHSDDPTAATMGGDLGFFTRDGMVPEFGDALFDHLDTLKPGDVVGPIKTDFGYHLIMFQDYQPPLAERLDALNAELAKPEADFAAIAKASSDGAQAPIGGDLDWVAETELAAAALAALTTLEPGAVSAPIALEDGYHVYQLIERAQRPLEPAQVAALRSTAFGDWYDPQREDAEGSGAIGRDESIFGSGS